MAALERVHTKPEAKEVEPVLSGLPVLKRGFDPQVGFDDAVDRFGGTTGADNALQDGHQTLSQSQEGGVVSNDGLQESEGALSRFAERTMAVDHGALQPPGPSRQSLKEDDIDGGQAGESLLTSAIQSNFEPFVSTLNKKEPRSISPRLLFVLRKSCTFFSPFHRRLLSSP